MIEEDGEEDDEDKGEADRDEEEQLLGLGSRGLELSGLGGARLLPALDGARVALSSSTFRERGLAAVLLARRARP